MERFNIGNCVIDALPEIHATRAFAKRHAGRVYLNYFVESQRGSYSWERNEHIVRENRTEALDTCRQHVRDGEIVLPRAGETIRVFASHVSADVKQLVEDEETGAQSYRYIRTGTNHYSLAFAYDCVAWSRDQRGTCTIQVASPKDRVENSIRTMEL